MGIGGSKTRKFASLIQHILKNEYDLVVLEGGISSNNLLGLAPLLASYQIPFKIACPKTNGSAIGNQKWLERLFEPKDFIEIESTQGKTETFYRDTLKASNPFIVKEGAKQVESIYGLLTLAQEIDHYNRTTSTEFENIFIDSGSGITAIGLLIGLQLFQSAHRQVVITLIAGTEKEFHSDLTHLVDAFNKAENQSIDLSKMHFKFSRPSTAKSFGSVNRTSLNDWIVSMKKLKIPIDLTYTSKHLSSVGLFCQQNELLGPQLFINSGSWFAARNHGHLLS